MRRQAPPGRPYAAFKFRHKWRRKRRAGERLATQTSSSSSCDPKKQEASRVSHSKPVRSKPEMSIGTRSASFKRSPPRPGDEPISESPWDTTAGTQSSLPHFKSRPPNSRLCLAPAKLISLLAILCWAGDRPNVSAFCPFRCSCDDQSLSANCTQVPSLSIVPMTLNPSLKRLTLNRLPLAELANSLSLYRQLEYLNLASNQLRQIKYQNFNFKRAPGINFGGLANQPGVGLQADAKLQSGASSLFTPDRGHLQHLANKQAPMKPHYHHNEPASLVTNSSQQEFNENNELLARHLKRTIDKSLASQPSSSVSASGSASGPGPSSSGLLPKAEVAEAELGILTGSQAAPSGKTIALGEEDELRYHLRELDLSDNRIDELGSVGATGSVASLNGPGANGYSEPGGELDLIDGRTQFVSGEPDGTGSDTENPVAALTMALGSPIGQHSHELASLRLRSIQLERQAPFLGLTKLEQLNLAGNKLARLKQHVFLGLVHLIHLDLSRNLLEHIDRFAFVGLIELRSLRLNSNRLAAHFAHQLGHALCRAPAVQLRHLNLSDQLPASSWARPEVASGSPQGQSLEVSAMNKSVIFPNQMLLCAPQLQSLLASRLQLSYIQANAFDNLNSLEQLDLSWNPLEQVPSDAFNYSFSRLGQSLRELDLSGTLIEFVNSNSFSYLKKLSKLRLNSAPRLVSFDLAAFSLIQEQQWISEDRRQARMSNGNKDTPWLEGVPGGRQVSSEQQTGNIEQLARRDDDFRLALKNLLPSHLFSRMVGSADSGSTPEPQTVQEGPPTQHLLRYLSGGPRGRLINEHLEELHLNSCPRLQSLHLSGEGSVPSAWLQLRHIGLSSSNELRELPLAQLVDLDWIRSRGWPIHLEVTGPNRLNCSSCQMGWLREAVRGMREGVASGPSPIELANAEAVRCLWSPQTTGMLGLAEPETISNSRCDNIGRQSLQSEAAQPEVAPPGVVPELPATMSDLGTSPVAPAASQTDELRFRQALLAAGAHLRPLTGSGPRQAASEDGSGVSLLWGLLAIGLLLVGAGLATGLLLRRGRPSGRRPKRWTLKWPPGEALESPGSSTSADTSAASSGAILSSHRRHRHHHCPTSPTSPPSPTPRGLTVRINAAGHVESVGGPPSAGPFGATGSWGLAEGSFPLRRPNLFSRIVGRLSGPLGSGSAPACDTRTGSGPWTRGGTEGTGTAYTWRPVPDTPVASNITATSGRARDVHTLTSGCDYYATSAPWAPLGAPPAPVLGGVPAGSRPLPADYESTPLMSRSRALGQPASGPLPVSLGGPQQTGTCLSAAANRCTPRAPPGCARLQVGACDREDYDKDDANQGESTTSGLLALSNGHIYVTLDRPIKRPLPVSQCNPSELDGYETSRLAGEPGSGDFSNHLGLHPGDLATVQQTQVQLNQPTEFYFEANPSSLEGHGDFRSPEEVYKSYWAPGLGGSPTQEAALAVGTKFKLDPAGLRPQSSAARPKGGPAGPTESRPALETIDGRPAGPPTGTNGSNGRFDRNGSSWRPSVFSADRPGAPDGQSNLEEPPRLPRRPACDGRGLEGEEEEEEGEPSATGSGGLQQQQQQQLGNLRRKSSASSNPKHASSSPWRHDANGAHNDSCPQQHIVTPNKSVARQATLGSRGASDRQRGDYVINGLVGQNLAQARKQPGGNALRPSGVAAQLVGTSSDGSHRPEAEDDISDSQWPSNASSGDRDSNNSTHSPPPLTNATLVPASWPDNSKTKRSAMSTGASNRNNEIYSNHFYYCKPQSEPS